MPSFEGTSSSTTLIPKNSQRPRQIGCQITCHLNSALFRVKLLMYCRVFTLGQTNNSMRKKHEKPPFIDHVHRETIRFFRVFPHLFLCLPLASCPSNQPLPPASGQAWARPVPAGARPPGDPALRQAHW